MVRVALVLVFAALFWLPQAADAQAGLHPEVAQRGHKCLIVLQFGERFSGGLAEVAGPCDDHHRDGQDERAADSEASRPLIPK